MNIDYPEASNLVIAKLCGCKQSGRKVAYSLINETHGLCLSKKDIIIGELEACEKLQRYTPYENDNRIVLEREVRELKMALDLMT
ncbi:MAG: hypothetical protein M3275_12590 [Thermoproteota archaeon]|nr:hypothetical protein [Thermoproteota archaeon]